MKTGKTIIATTTLAAVLLGVLCPAAKADQIVDVVQAPTGFFVPTDGQKYDAPYYRWWNEDWGWTHTPIAEPFTSAKLWISAFDIDTYWGEVDVISIVNGVPVTLGTMTGVNDQWSYAEFDVTAFDDEIAAGLQVWINIDSTHNYDTWAVTLAKSVLTLDGATPPAPPPGVPDGGSTAALLAAAIGGIGALRRKLTA